MFRYISLLAYKFEPLIFIAVSLLLSVKILILLPLRLEATELLDLELSLEVVPLSSAEAPTLKPQVTQLEDAADPWEMRAAVKRVRVKKENRFINFIASALSIAY